MCLCVAGSSATSLNLCEYNERIISHIYMHIKRHLLVVNLYKIELNKIKTTTTTTKIKEEN